MSKCLVVPRKKLEEMEFWQRLEKDNGVYSSGIILASKELDELLTLARAEQQFLERKGEDGVETKPEWQQIIFYALLVQGDKFFVYKRSSSATGEERLAAKLSAGVGGHIEPHDVDLVDSLPRELDEELAFTKNGLALPVPNNLKIIGLIKDEKDEVGKVHLGLVCVVKVDSDVTVSIKSDENVEGWMTTLSDYKQLLATGNYIPEGWTTLLVDKFAVNILN